MSLSDLIRGARGNASVGVATVTPATVATDRPESRSTVASVATVTVANAPARETASRWLLHLPDGLLEVTFAPAACHADVLGRYPLAVAAEPLPDPAPVWMPADLRALLLPLDLDDRALARDMYAIDPDGTRLLVEGMVKG